MDHAPIAVAATPRVALEVATGRAAPLVALAEEGPTEAQRLLRHVPTTAALAGIVAALATVVAMWVAAQPVVWAVAAGVWSRS